MVSELARSITTVRQLQRLLPRAAIEQVYDPYTGHYELVIYTGWREGSRGRLCWLKGMKPARRPHPRPARDVRVTQLDAEGNPTGATTTLPDKKGR